MALVARKSAKAEEEKLPPRTPGLDAELQLSLAQTQCSMEERRKQRRSCGGDNGNCSKLRGFSLYHLSFAAVLAIRGRGGGSRRGKSPP